jgi:subtilisin
MHTIKLGGILARSFFILTLCFILIGSQVTSLANAAGPIADNTYGPLIERALEKGTIQVIVGIKLNGPLHLEGDLSTDQIALQRADIKSAQRALKDSLAGYKVDVYTEYDIIPYLAASVDPEALSALIASPLVVSIEEDIPVKADLASSIPQIGADNVWAGGFEGSGWAVAVLDTGVQWDHPFLGGSASSRVISEACYSNAGGLAGKVSLCPSGNNSEVTGHAADPTIAACLDSGGNNICEHGSHVAGIVAGHGGGATGVNYSGVARGANIIAVQVFTRFDSDADCGSGNAPCVMSYTSDQLLGLQRVYNLRTTYNIASVNMSLGGSTKYTASCDTNSLKSIIDQLYSADIATVIAAGNNGWTDGISAPACISTAVAVGATTDSGNPPPDVVASFSNSSLLVDLLAPGVSIDSSIPTSTYANFSGTSMATPHVAGAFALLKSVKPAATVGELLNLMQTTGIPVIDLRNNVTRPRIQLDAAAASLNPDTWIGNTIDWNTDGNWSSGSVPGRVTNVLIPTSPSGGYFPTLDVPGSVFNFTLASGAMMTMTGSTLSVFGDWFEKGTSSFFGKAGAVIFNGSLSQGITTTNGTGEGFFDLQLGDGVKSHQVILNSDISVVGSLDIMTGTVFIPGDQTVWIAGNFTDFEQDFDPGTSTFNLVGTNQAIYQVNQVDQLNESFSIYDASPVNSFYNVPPAGWTVTLESNPTDSNPWLFGRTGSSGYPQPDRGGQVRHIWVSNPSKQGDFDTWLFSPGLSLKEGIQYRLWFDYGAIVDNSIPTHERLVVKRGSAQDAASMTDVLFSNTNIDNLTWITASINFTVPGDGVYYFGFNTFGDAATTWDIALDNIKVTAATGPIFYNLNIIGSHATFNGDVSVQNNLVVEPTGVMDLEMHDLSVDGTLTNNGTLAQKQDLEAGNLVEFLHIKDKNGSADKYHGVDITSSDSMGLTTVEIDGNQTGGCTNNPGDPLIHRCFRITPASSASAVIKLWYTEAERNGQVANGLKLWHLSGSPSMWVPAGDSYTSSETGTACLSGSGNACWMQAQNVNAYSPFGVGSGGVPTTVRLESFSVSQERSLVWALIAGFGAILAFGLFLFRRTMQ